MAEIVSNTDGHSLAMNEIDLRYRQNTPKMYMKAEKVYTWPRGYKTIFSCSAHLSIKVKLLINIKIAQIY